MVYWKNGGLLNLKATINQNFFSKELCQYSLKFVNYLFLGIYLYNQLFQKIFDA